MSNLSHRTRPVRLNVETLEGRITPTAGWKPPTNPTPPATPQMECLDLGVATPYNAMVFNQFSAQWTETEGRLAVGGTANLQGYGVGARLANSTGKRDDLIVGGNLNYTYGQSFAGNIVYGGSANLTGIGTPGGNVRKGAVIDFSAAEREMVNRSEAFGREADNGTIVRQWGQVSLTGTNAAKNVFNLKAADFNNCWGLSVNVPKGSTVVINVWGTDVRMQYFGIQLNGTQASKVLFNFANAQNLTFNGIGIEGSVLAPKANVYFNNGNIRGNLIAKNFCGTGELRHVPPEICIDVPKAYNASLCGYVGQTPYCPPGYTGPVAGVTVILTGTTPTGTVNRTLKSRPDGYFEFGQLPAGTYTVSVVVPASFKQGSARTGDHGGTVANATTLTGIVLGPNAKSNGYAFTLISTAGYSVGT